MSNYIQQLQWCSNCVMMSTRPRITFNDEGKCNACLWAEKKKSIDWKYRINQLEKLLDKFRNVDSEYNCLVPVSGGKDGSYIAYNLKHKYKMRPLCVTINPPLQLPLGMTNLKNFTNSGYDLVSIDPNYDLMQKINLKGLDKIGFPYFGWLASIHTAVARVASSFKIPLVFYAEDGEVEYELSYEDGRREIIRVEKALLAIGRTPNVENIGLENVSYSNHTFGVAVIYTGVKPL